MRLVCIVIVSLAAVLATVTLEMAAEVDERSLRFFVCWTGAPYLGYCVLAATRRNDRIAILVGTVISAGAATALYWLDIWPQVAAKARGEEVMNCAGPLVELGFPILQWLSVGVLWGATKPCSLIEEIGDKTLISVKRSQE